MIAAQTSDVSDCELIVMGMFPPPVTGAAKNLLLMQEEMLERGLRTAIIDTGIHEIALNRSGAYHAKRIKHFLTTIRQIHSIKNATGLKPVLYCVPDGGLGLWYTYIYLAAATKRVRRIIMHHRTFQYIDEFSSAMNRICNLNNTEIFHVFLSTGMAEKFQRQYGTVNYNVSTNARYVSPRTPDKSNNQIIIGHLSNLSAGKGFFEVVETFQLAISRGLNVRLELAGPVLDREVGLCLDKVIKEHGSSINYHGPLSGKAKDDFYDMIHVFLFPTHWKQEAQPNVVYEAFAGGAAVIAYGRGCISEQLDVEFGHAISPDEAFAPTAVDVIYRWSESLAKPDLVARIADHVASERNASHTQHDALRQLLLR